MKIRALLSIGLFISLLLPAAFGQRMKLSDGVKAAVVRSDEIRVYALLSADINSLDDLLAKDCLYVHSTGRTQSKSQLLDDLKSGALKYERLQYTAAPLVRLFGEDTAIVTGTTELAVNSKEAGLVKRTLVTTCVYVLQNERWQLASYQSTTAAP